MWGGAYINFLLDKNRPLFGKLIGEVRGRLGEKSLTGIEVIGNWSIASTEATSFKIEFKNVPPEHSLCLQVLSEMASPAFWYAAKEVCCELPNKFAERYFMYTCDANRC